MSEVTNQIDATLLKDYIERLNRLESEKKEIGDTIKEVLQEAKARGFDVKTLKKILKAMNEDLEKLEHEETTYEIYKRALGLPSAFDE